MTTSVSGFGDIPETSVVIRPPGQSYTCKEHAASLNIQNDVSVDIAFVHLDGGFFPDGNACDFSISSQAQPPYGFLLELKGKDIPHAVEQLGQTLERLKNGGIQVCYRKAAVVSSGFRMPSGMWQKCQTRFFAAHRVHLRRHSNNAKITFSQASG